MKAVLVGLTIVLAIFVFRAWANPCSAPITYRLGEVDSRFGLSTSAVRTALRRAEAVWEDPTGRELFRYEDDGQLIVNFVYDTRQLTAQQNAFRKDKIDRAGGEPAGAKAEYESASTKYENVRRSYLAAQEVHDQRIEAHNREVAERNTRGGATPEQYRTMRDRAATLDKEAAALEKRRLEVNALADRANTLSRRYNQLADEVNANVEAVNATAGVEFKQGRYVRNSGGVRIDIFEFVGNDDLVHVLAHEFGHALGIEHDNNRESIMYGQNSTRAVVLTAADREALRSSCRL